MTEPTEPIDYSFPQLLDTSSGGLIAQGDYTHRLSALLATLTARPELCAAVKRLALSTAEHPHPTWSPAGPHPEIKIGPAQQLLQKTAVDSLTLVDLHEENAPEWLAMVAESAPGIKQLELDANNERAHIEHVQFNTLAESLAGLASLTDLTLQSVYFDDEDDYDEEIEFPEDAEPTFTLKALTIGDSGEAWPVPIEKLAWLSGASEGSPSSLVRLSLSLCDVALVEWITTNLTALTHCSVPLIGDDTVESDNDYFDKVLEIARLPALVELKLIYADSLIDDEALSGYTQQVDALNAQLGKQVIVLVEDSE